MPLRATGEPAGAFFGLLPSCFPWLHLGSNLAKNPNVYAHNLGSISMLHGHEKSDPAIVAVKPANNAERSAAELVEQRAGTEGNAVWQSTRRTQSRISVSQATALAQAPAKRPRIVRAYPKRLIHAV